jgi:hypothetical protein
MLRRPFEFLSLEKSFATTIKGMPIMISNNFYAKINFLYGLCKKRRHFTTRPFKMKLYV